MSRRTRKRWLKNRSTRKTKKEKKQQKRRCGSPGDYSFRAGWKDRHHITAKQFGGKKTIENLLLMDRHRHNAYHLLFGNMSFYQVIILLLRVLRLKNHADYPRAEDEVDNYLNEQKD